ncbi:MAG: CtsR family transcriptional regulator [Clostridiales bacterium]|nr:CtsR family transcriptional regulator [Clostridiales bacterium]MCD7828170.1 CtsR family transcriptional regulator [Clostridiales bacterium]
MNLSNQIAHMLLEMLDETGRAEIQRNELAEKLGCVPSQINYVISSRFTPERGYTVESKRGGGGYIKISRISYTSKDQVFMHIVNSIGESIDEQSARAIIVNLNHNEMLSSDNAKLMLAAINENCYKNAEPELRPKIRASILKQMFLSCT